MNITVDSFSEERHSELVVGLVAAVGTETPLVVTELKQELSRAGYQAEHIKISSDVIPKLQDIDVTGDSNYERIDRLMTAGNVARRDATERDGNETLGNSVLAYGAAACIFAKRPTSDGKPEPNDRKAFIIDSLKRPEEVETLRRIYPQGFVLIGVDSIKSKRVGYLKETLQMVDEEVESLIRRDENEVDEAHGQRVSKSFHLADFFIKLTSSNDELRYEVRRMVELWFGCPTHTPTFDEFAMFFAFGAALRSADLSRQVGAVVARDHQIVGTGANDSPKANGGLYWPQRDGTGKVVDDENGRDYMRGGDSNRQEQLSIIDDIVNRADDYQLDKNSVRELLGGSRIRDLTEFGRVVHAEMEAILSCGRQGTSIVGGEIFCTTFPCHNCAKHIIAAGLKRVVYIEPYAKSKALEFHDDAIVTSTDDGSDESKVLFEPFSGIGPRRFYDLFSMHLSSGYDLVRKDTQTGETIGWDIESAPLRLSMKPTSYIDLEMQASRQFNDMLNRSCSDGETNDQK